MTLPDVLACKMTIQVGPDGNPILGANGQPIWIKIKDCGDPQCTNSEIFDIKAHLSERVPLTLPSEYHR